MLIPGVGRSVNGARRWLPLGIANLQPSEFMKLVVVLYAASYAVRKAAFLHARQPLKQTLLRGFLPLFVVTTGIGALLLLEPDFGAFVVIVAIAFGILFLGGLDWRLFLGLSLLLPVALGAILVAAPYRLQRLTAFLDPWSDPFGKGYQLSHSLIAFGRGEWLGAGLGASVEKLLYLPEAHTDFLLAVIAEELGLVGVLAVLALFVWLLFRAYAIGRQAALLKRPFAALVAQGIGLWIGVQAFINIGVNMGVLPTKGLTLPLLSFGGSGDRRQLRRAGDPAARRLRESPAAAGVPGMSAGAMTVMITTGGTGGHIFPGLAVAANSPAGGTACSGSAPATAWRRGWCRSTASTSRPWTSAASAARAGGDCCSARSRSCAPVSRPPASSGGARRRSSSASAASRPFPGR